MFRRKVMSRPLLILVILLLASLACSLTSSDDSSQATAIPIRSTNTLTFQLTPSPRPFASATSLLAATPTQSTNPGSGAGQPTAALPPTITNCTPRTDWVIYTIQAGDTLGGIAQKVGSTVNDLTRANCLANPDSIVIGQQLRVPQLPSDNLPPTATKVVVVVTATPTATTPSGGNTSNGAPVLGTLAIKPLLQVEGIGWLSMQATIALDVGVVSDADRVRFYVGVSSNDPSPINFGTDIDPFDGTQVQYTFNNFDSGNTLYFWAVGENEFGSIATSKIAVKYDPNYTPSDSSGNTAVSISPNLGFDGSVYTVQGGASVTVSWVAAPTTASKVDFLVAPTGTGTTFTLIGTDSNPADGSAIPWTVPSGILGHIMAQATFSNGTTKDSLLVNVYSEN
jgi:LysM repeat protein